MTGLRSNVTEKAVEYSILKTLVLTIHVVNRMCFPTILITFILEILSNVLSRIVWSKWRQTLERSTTHSPAHGPFYGKLGPLVTRVSLTGV